MTPDLVLDMRNSAKTLVTQIHIGREFDRDRRRAAARAGRAAVVRRDDRLLGRRGADHLDVEHPGLDQRTAAASSAASCRSIEIYTPRKDARGAAHRHQARDRAVRRGGVRRARAHRADLDKQRRAERERLRSSIMECVPQIFPVEGLATPMAPGARSSSAAATCTAGRGRRSGRSTTSRACSDPTEEDIFSFPESDAGFASHWEVAAGLVPSAPDGRFAFSCIWRGFCLPAACIALTWPNRFLSFTTAIHCSRGSAPHMSHGARAPGIPAASTCRRRNWHSWISKCRRRTGINYYEHSGRIRRLKLAALVVRCLQRTAGNRLRNSPIEET